MIFDTHAHYDDEQFDEDRGILLSSLATHGVGNVVNVGCDMKSSRGILKMVKEYDFLYGAIGVHPSDVDCLNEEEFQFLSDHLQDEKIVALGEIGLDYYWDKEAEVQEKQRYWFRRQFLLAKDQGMPVIIHSRDAAQDTMDMLKDMKGEEIPVVIHCYSYSPEMAREYVKMGYYIGIGGVVTFKNAKKVKQVAEETPLNKILLETDCPYLAPEPNRGQRNSSINLTYVAAEIARLKGISPEEVIAVTEENAKRFYFERNQ